ncbi:MAG: PPC domain-containing protein [Pirellulales bacterium]
MVVTSFAHAQEKKDVTKKPDKPPVVKTLSPVAMPTAGKQTFTIQGLRLKDVNEVTCGVEGATVKLLGTQTIKPGKDEESPEFDSSVRFEVALTPDVAPGELTVELKLPPATFPCPFAIRVIDKSFLLEQREPADGFKTAQPLKPGDIVRGSVQAPRDVDVFRFELKKDEAVSFEVIAGRSGSALDAILTLYDDRGRTVLSDDDHAGSRNPVIRFTPPADGVYFLALIDALDNGGDAYTYLLKTRLEK